MSKIQEIKDTVAQLKGFENFDDLYFDLQEMKGFEDVINGVINDVSKRYAKECVKASLEKASENRDIFDDEGYFFQYVKPKSITNPENIILL